jgi:hypothetical protein
MDTAAVLPEMPEGPREYQSMERRAGHDRRQSNWRNAMDGRDGAAKLLHELDHLLQEWQLQIHEHEEAIDDEIADGFVWCHARLRQVIDDYRKIS